MEREREREREREGACCSFLLFEKKNETKKPAVSNTFVFFAGNSPREIGYCFLPCHGRRKKKKKKEVGGASEENRCTNPLILLLTMGNFGLVQSNNESFVRSLSWEPIKSLTTSPCPPPQPAIPPHKSTVQEIVLLLLFKTNELNFNFNQYFYFKRSGTSLEMCWSFSTISEKSGRWVGSCCQHLSISSFSFGCVFFGIVGLKFYPNFIIFGHLLKIILWVNREESTFWTTPTAACNGVRYS